MSKPRIRAILFDKDGTLVDFEKTWVGVGDALALSAANGDRAEADRLLAIAGFDFATGTYKPDSVFAAGTNAEVVALWYPDFTEEEREERTLVFNAFTAAQGAAHAVGLPGLNETVSTLFDQGLLLGVVTNDSGEGARLTLQALGIADRFLAAYGYDTVPRPKPAPDPVLAFSALSGVAPEEILVIGDNCHDLEMARAARVGLAVGVLSGTGTQASLSPMADVVLGSIAELPAFLARGR
ncbi:MAG: HAD family hydrolase [Mesorhizobium amorphae]|nr:MAG: HAD family hydrolase [Mesorhizobium amorphae]